MHSSINLKANKYFYEGFWREHRVFDPKEWAHWEIIKKFRKGVFLEIGPGVKPKIPIKDNYFLDISKEAIKKLRNLGGHAYVSDLTKKFPFPNNKFDLICTFETLEHIENDSYVLGEIRRTLKPSGKVIVSFPLNMRYWNKFDEIAGHLRRYEPAKLNGFFRKNGFRVIKFSKIEIPWPGGVFGTMSAFLYKHFPPLIYKFMEYADSTPFSPLKKPLHLKNWSKNMASELENETTGLFILEKNSD